MELPLKRTGILVFDEKMASSTMPFAVLYDEEITFTTNSTKLSDTKKKIFLYNKINISPDELKAMISNNEYRFQH